MVKYDYSSRIDRINQLVNGMKARLEEMAAWGYPEKFITDLGALCSECNRLQDVRNANKAASVAATTKQQELLNEAEKKAAMVRHSVRSRLPKAEWNHFRFYEGVTAPKNSGPAEPGSQS